MQIKSTPTKNHWLIFFVTLTVISISFIPSTNAHQPHGSEISDSFVRVVSADYDSRTYTFSCKMDPDNTKLRDWFIRPDNGDMADEQNEAEILDQTSKTLTYTFETGQYYHIACLIYDDQTGHLHRGDLHIDLRASNNWNPKIVELSSNGLTSTVRCDYSGNTTGGVTWEVINANTGVKTSLGAGNPITYTVPKSGLFDYSCHVDGKGTKLAVEYFSQGNPYFPTKEGVPDGITNVWVRGTTPPPSNNTNQTNITTPPPTNTTNTSGSSTTYTNVQNIPATCTGGTITSDIFNGGRDITCTNAGNSLRIAAWDKPNFVNPKYFEMYKNTQTGSGIKICLGTTCISNNGFDISPNYPITIANSNSTTNGTGTNSTGNNSNGNTTTTPPSNTSTSTSYISIKDIPATCSTGTITSDTYNGARRITCTNASNSMSIEGWNKPTSTNPQYFELYKKNQTGTAMNICIAQTCIKNNGYERSPDFPIVVISTGNNTPANNNTNNTNNTNTTTPPPTNTSTNTTTTYTNVKDIPATCTGGTITSDIFNGGRDITCTNAGNSLRIAAWDKPNSANPQYFEMYKNTQTGSGIKICLGTTCISNNGFDQSPNYPIVIVTQTNNSGNALSAPQWYSNYDKNVAPNYFHLEMQQPSNYQIITSTDFEVLNSTTMQRVWSSYNATGTSLFHVHPPDGVYENSYATKTQLNHAATYIARARFKAANGTYSAWSQNKIIETLASSNSSNILNATSVSGDWITASGFKVETVASGFDYPVHIAFAPSGMYNSLPDNQEPLFYVTELYGKVKVVHKDGSQATYAQDLLNFDPFGSITGGGQMGVIGLYVDNITGDLFVGMTYVEGNSTIKNKVERFVSSNDGNSFISKQIVINNLPSSASHQLEQLTKGPNGKLYINLGDALTPSNAQSDSVLAGKIISMNMNGTNVQIYAKGLRNPFGADWRPGYNVLYATDNAPGSGDRVIKITQGTNYGWGMNDNFTTWHSKVLFYTDVSPVDVEFNEGGKGFPSELTGKLYVAVAGPVYTEGPTPNGKVIWELTLNTQGNVSSSRQFLKYNGSGYGTPMGLDFGPDGLYFTDIYGEAGSNGYGSEGRVMRILPGTPSGNSNESEDFRTNIYISLWYPKIVNGNTVEYEFTCNPIDGSGNYRYDWVFRDGQKLFNDGYNKKIHSYPYTDQNYTVTCTARDMATSENVSASMIVNPSNYLAEY